jgi:hypothetical protein
MSLRTALRAAEACLRHGTDGKVHVLMCRTVSTSDKPRAVCGRAAFVWLSTAADVIDCDRCAEWAARNKASDEWCAAQRRATRERRAARPKPPPKPAGVDRRRCAACKGAGGALVRAPNPSGALRWWHRACLQGAQTWGSPT